MWVENLRKGSIPNSTKQKHTNLFLDSYSLSLNFLSCYWLIYEYKTIIKFTVINSQIVLHLKKSERNKKCCDFSKKLFSFSAVSSENGYMVKKREKNLSPNECQFSLLQPSCSKSYVSYFRPFSLSYTYQQCKKIWKQK